MKILVAPDKFKGTLTAEAAARAIARGWRRQRPADRLELLPISDGGDGFGLVLRRPLGGRAQNTRTIDAAHRPCVATWWWQAKTRTAIVESARVVGLAMLPPGKFHPFALDTFGLGKIVQAACARGARQIIIGIGGSATNDGGFGLARALGWEFYGRNGALIESWTGLAALAEIRPPRARRFVKIIVAVDVQNRLLGARGATRVYGPQKGLRPGDLKLAECCLRRLALVAKRQMSRDFSIVPSAGAAGGLGFGLLAFLGARTTSGFDLFAAQARLAQRLTAVELVITGEGAIDDSTLMGKGTGQLAQRCRRAEIPCLGLAGIVNTTSRQKLFAQVRAMTELTTPARAKAKPAFWLERLAAAAAKSLNSDLAALTSRA